MALKRATRKPLVRPRVTFIRWSTVRFSPRFNTPLHGRFCQRFMSRFIPPTALAEVEEEDIANISIDKTSLDVFARHLGRAVGCRLAREQGILPPKEEKP